MKNWFFFFLAFATQIQAESPWFTASVPQGAFLVDSRSWLSRTKEPMPEAIPFAWEDFSEKEFPHQGKLVSKEKIFQILESKGYKKGNPIVVIGEGRSGWGEEARLVWTFRQIGIQNAQWLLPKSQGNTTALVSHSNKISLKFDHLSITKQELESNLSSYTILDTREKSEYEGSTLYGETRGGHIPGAKHLYYKTLFHTDGSLKSEKEVKEILAKLSLDSSKPVVAYCTGGVRSALVVGVLRSYGIPAINYPGSMWEWSHDPKSPLSK